MNGQPVSLQSLVEWLDRFLRTTEVRDYPNAENGLQVEGPDDVRKIAVAVDACEFTIQEAVAQECDLLLVHHGLLWSGLSKFTGPLYRKLKLAFDHPLAVYSSHLPLDLHPEVGNNAVLARLLGMPPAEPFHAVNGEPIGLRATWEIPLPELLRRITETTGCDPHIATGGPGICKNVALVTGGAGSDIHAIAAAGIDTFITGEGPHWSFTAAEELGVNLIYAGHYATETFGVRALAEVIEKKFGIQWVFVDHATGL